jgi:dUTP pyrophosphatase
MDAALPASSSGSAEAVVAVEAESAATAAATTERQPSAAAVRFIKIQPRAYFPTKQSANAAGYDLRACRTMIILPHSKEEILTDLLLCLSPGCFAFVAPCSDWGLLDRLDVVSDVLDASFWKNLGVVVCNLTPSPLRVPRGSVIFQIVLLKHEEP